MVIVCDCPAWFYLELPSLGVARGKVLEENEWDGSVRIQLGRRITAVAIKGSWIGVLCLLMDVKFCVRKSYFCNLKTQIMRVAICLCGMSRYICLYEERHCG